MTWVALAFTTGTLSAPSVADGRARDETLASPSSTCSRGARRHLSQTRESHASTYSSGSNQIQEKIREGGLGCPHPIRYVLSSVTKDMTLYK